MPVLTDTATRLLVILLSSVLLMSQSQCGGGDEGTPESVGPTSTRSALAIAQENQRPGSSAWYMDRPAEDGQIAGYADRESYALGADVRISASAEPPGLVSWKVFRMGGYRGLGARLYAEGGPLAVPRQPEATFEPGTGLVVAGWPPTFTISTRDPDQTPWLTGVYMVLLTKEDGWQAYVPFIIRDDTRDAEVAVQLPTATWHAYNSFGGESCYVSAHGLPGGAARKVSLDRPSTLAYGSATFLYLEHEGVRWLEDQGYDVEYLSSIDIGGAVNRIGRHRLYISLAHEEYTTMAAIDRLEAAVANGTSLALLTGNTMVWQVRFEDNERTMACYKEHVDEDPMRLINPRLVSTRFRDPPVNRPENQLTGVMSDGSHNEEPADWVVTNADHWVYAGTGLGNGSRIPGLVFIEWDSFVDNGLNPPGLTVLASSEVPNNIRPGSRHEATVYERGAAFVFAAGSIFYNQLLRTEPVVATITTNLLNRTGARPYQAEP
jgi:hypothetical protein